MGNHQQILRGIGGAYHTSCASATSTTTTMWTASLYSSGIDAAGQEAARGACRLLLTDPGGGGGGDVWGPGQPWPTHQPTHIRKIFLRRKTKLKWPEIEG